ncbi:MAG: ParB/RepB/Spo0J family partition protein [Anaerolineales bacterium]|nr:ParB/RepB/Spo0J family partition protein [Anaerolineales bacterium]
MTNILPVKESGNNLALEQAQTPDETTSIQLVTLNLIEANPFQTRVFYDEKDIVALAEDIRQQCQYLPDTLGLLQVPKGRLTDEGRVQLGFGHRRLAAFSYLVQHYGSEWQRMPVQIEALTDEAMADMAWSENEVRADISAIEKAWALQRAMAKFNYSMVELAQRRGMPKSTLSNLLRLLQLPDLVQQMVLRRELQERHARTLLPLIQTAQNEAEAIRLATVVTETRLSVLQLEEKVAEVIHQLTVEIEMALAQFSAWDDLLPNGCSPTCPQCLHFGRWKHQLRCSRPELYQQKYQAWWIKTNQTEATEGDEFNPTLTDTAIELPEQIGYKESNVDDEGPAIQPTQLSIFNCPRCGQKAISGDGVTYQCLACRMEWPTAVNLLNEINARSDPRMEQVNGSQKFKRDDDEQDCYDPYQFIFIQSRAAINYAIINEYATMMSEGIVFDPIEGVQDAEGRIYIWDGYHRGEAAKRAGIRLRVRIRPGTQTDAEWLALSANQKHGQRRSMEDKQHVVRQALLHPYGLYMSDRALTRHCGVDRRLVVKVRQEMEKADEIPQETRRFIQRGDQTYEIDVIRAAKAEYHKVSGWLIDIGTSLNAWTCELCVRPQNRFKTQYQLYLAGEQRLRVICSECYQNRIRGIEELPEHLLDDQTEIRKRQRAYQAWLLRQQIRLIKERFVKYPELRHTFLEQLRNSNEGQALTVDELAQAITQALIKHGVRFEEKKTWNSVPTPQCLGCRTTFEKLRETLRNGQSEFVPHQDGTVSQFCQHLRLFPQYTEQFKPTPDGSVVREVADGLDSSHYPIAALTQDRQGVRGEKHSLLNHIEAYCVAPDVHQPASCFNQQEQATAQAAIEILTKQGLPAVLPHFLKERQRAEAFIWLEPQLEGQPCTPQNCKHAHSHPPGFMVLVEPGGVWKMACVHQECGSQAQGALINWETEQRQLEQQRQQAALNDLRQITVERTLLAPAGEGIDLSKPSLLTMIETLLVPNWDTLSMFHIITGWQQATRVQIAHELGFSDPMSKEVTYALQDRFGELAEKPKTDSIGKLFILLRERLVHSPEELSRWIACLALVRSWRDEVNTIEQIEEVTQMISLHA